MRGQIFDPTDYILLSTFTAQNESTKKNNNNNKNDHVNISTHYMINNEKSCLKSEFKKITTYYIELNANLITNNKTKLNCKL